MFSLTYGRSPLNRSSLYRRAYVIADLRSSTGISPDFSANFPGAEGTGFQSPLGKIAGRDLPTPPFSQNKPVYAAAPILLKLVKPPSVFSFFLRMRRDHLAPFLTLKVTGLSSRSSLRTAMLATVKVHERLPYVPFTPQLKVPSSHRNEIFLFQASFERSSLRDVNRE